MGRNSVISREARQYIVQQVQENGIVPVADVANIVRRYYQFDPQKSFNHDVEQYSRRILANQKDNNGNRTLIAVKGEPGVYIDLDHCKDLLRLRKAVEQLTDRVTGLEKNITKGRKRIEEIEGQLTFEGWGRIGLTERKIQNGSYL